MGGDKIYELRLDAGSEKAPLQARLLSGSAASPESNPSKAGCVFWPKGRMACSPASSLLLMSSVCAM